MWAEGNVGGRYKGDTMGGLSTEKSLIVFSGR
jgi:hypothetical protein